MESGRENRRTPFTHIYYMQTPPSDDIELTEARVSPKQSPKRSPPNQPARLISQSGGSRYSRVTASEELIRSYSNDDAEDVSPLSPNIAYGDEYHYLEESISDAIRSRGGWLAFFLVGLWGAAFVVNHFEHMVQHNVELAHFVPLIIGHGGNAGSQAVSAVIRALATKSVYADKHIARVLGKESAIGVVIGLALGLVVVLVSRLTQLVSHEIGMVVAITLPLVSLFANGIGALLPLLAARAGSDPALTSAPLMTTIIDSLGLVVYFMVAKYYLEWAQFHPDFHHDISHTHAALGEGNHRPGDAPQKVAGSAL